MAQLRRATGMALACGQNEGLVFRFRDLLLREAIDYAQPNVCITGGFTQCVKIAGLARRSTCRSPTAAPGAYHNMHLQAGVANGRWSSIHYLAVELYKQIYRGLPEPEDGWLTLPDTPGLGFEPDRDAIRDREGVASKRGLIAIVGRGPHATAHLAACIIWRVAMRLLKPRHYHPTTNEQDEAQHRSHPHHPCRQPDPAAAAAGVPARQAGRQAVRPEAPTTPA